MINWMEEFNQAQVLKEGHFVYTSGRHGIHYFNKDSIYCHPDLISKVGRDLATRFCQDEIQCVVGPALGGIILSQWVAYHLTQLMGKEVLSVYAEKVGEELDLKRGYEQIVQGRRCLIVEDVITTGGSVAKVVHCVRRYGGKAETLGAICKRGDFDPLALEIQRAEFLVELNLASWAPTDCPICN